MKISEYKVADFGQMSLSDIKREKKSEISEEVSTLSGSETLSVANAKTAAFISDVKAINETMLGIGLAENSIQKISGERMEESVRDLRNITTALKDMLTKSFETNVDTSRDYGVESIKANLYGTNASQFHDFDYLASRAVSLLA